MPTINGLLVRPFAPTFCYLQRRDQPVENLRFACFTRDSIYSALCFRAQSSSQGDSLSHERMGIAHLYDQVERPSMVSSKARACSGSPPRDQAHPVLAHPSLRFRTEEMAGLLKARGSSLGEGGANGASSPPSRRRGKKFELVGQHMRTLK